MTILQRLELGRCRDKVSLPYLVALLILRPTSHMRLRARDEYTSSTLIGGKRGAGPSSLLHTTLEGSTECLNAR